MRIVGVVLLVLGLVAAVAGTFSGFGSLFSWNGRHPISVVPLEEGPTTQELVPEPGRRYTLSVEVVFEREGLRKEEGITQVEAKMPLVVRVKDPMGTSLVEATGWLDPAEPPSVLYGQAVREPAPRPGTQTAAPTRRSVIPELVVERLVGPFSASSNAPLSVYVDIGPDRVGSARIASRRLVIHDDRMPPSIRSSFIVAGVGLTAFLTGVVLVVVGWFKRRRAPRKRGGIRASDVV